MAEYDSAIALAKRLIDKKGRTVTVRKPNVAPTDTDKPWDVQENPPLTFDAKAVVVPMESRYVDGSTVLLTDKLMYVAAADATFPITTDCRVADRGYENQIIMVDTLEPGEQAVLYTVAVR